MNRIYGIGLRGFFLLSLFLLDEASRPVRGGEDKKPVHLDVLLPEDAELEVNGYKTKSTGETRRFESPPVEMGRNYSYSLKVAWQGHTLTRRIRVQPEQPMTLDLRKELQALAAPKPVGSFALLVPPALMLQADQKTVFPLRVKRFDFPDSIRIRFENLPKGITVAEVMLPEGQSESNATLIAAANAPPGSHEIRVAAAGGDMKDVSTIKVMIAKPEIKTESKHEKKPVPPPETKVTHKPEKPAELKPENKPAKTVEHKPETKPAKTVELKPENKPAKTVELKPENKPAKTVEHKPETRPVVQLVLPRSVELPAGRTKYAEVQVKTVDGSSLAEEPTVTLTVAPDRRVRSVPWMSSFKAGQSTATIGFAVTAETSAPAGSCNIRVLAVAGTNKVEGSFKIIVKESPP